MTETQIQAFFNSKVKTCRGGSDQYGPIICLKDFKYTSVNRPADSYCKGYTGAANESAARIIYKVSQSCGINPQVLIVMLQKEQSLVTHTWPSYWRYDKALGQGCPDTAPCDPKFVGFFHQIYGAARQMQLYMEGVHFTWYAPGKTWNILYNPNKSCGTSPVLVANKATSALYYYTPYQPNAAAMKAGYGEGDGCSSYGNRNFYNYFTDWFGSTQAPAETPAILKVGIDIFYISQGTRYHVTPEDWSEYRAKFGQPTVVSSVSSYRDGGDTSRFVRNSKTGEIAYFMGGATHRFATCELITRWAGDCYSRVEMNDADFHRIGAGPEMTRFARTSTEGTVYEISAGVLLPLYDSAAAAGANNGSEPFAAVMAPAQKSKFSVDTRVRFAPGQFLSVVGSDKVFLATPDGRLLHVPSWDLIKDMGLSRTKVTVAASAVNGYSTDTLHPLVQCGDAVYVPSGTGMRVLGKGNLSGITASVLDGVTCARLDLSDSPIASELFVRFDGSDKVLHAAGGVLRHVLNGAQVRSINGGAYPRVNDLRAGSASAFAMGTPYTGAATLVRAEGTEEVWFVDGETLLHLPDWETAADLGLRRYTYLETPAVLSALSRRGTIGTTVTCAGVAYTADSGIFTKSTGTISKSAVALASVTCDALGID
ncbi:MAG: hypothetical protein WBA87_04975 [Microbacterium sp.]